MGYVQLDDGYQKMPLPYSGGVSMAEGWGVPDEKKFPGGHRQIVDTVKKAGFRPGIWTNCNITNPEFAANHRDCLLLDSDGSPLLGEWIDYVLNCTRRTFDGQVRPVYERLAEFGYRYIKIDALWHLLFDGLHEAVRRGLLSNAQAQLRFRAFLEACRAGMGEEAYFLASWGEMNEAVGVVDACRIAMDANPTWAGVRMQLVETARWFHAQRILFTIDPDHICARTNFEWCRTLLSLVSLSGGLYMLSDLPSDYDEERLGLIRRTLPPLATVTAEIGPLKTDFPAFTWTKLHGFAVHSREGRSEAEGVSREDALDMAGDYPTMDDDHPFSSLWAVHLENPFRSWCVAARIATAPLRESVLPLESLGLDPERVYYAFDF